MKANVITSFGSPSEVFKIVDTEIPQIGKNEILAKVHYTSVNPVDCRIRKKAQIARNFPLTLGYDLYGEVVDVGEQVSDLKIGDRIIASPSPFKPGANAEYIAIHAKTCLKVDDLDPVIGAAIPLVGITAYEGLFDRLRLKEGDTVMIQAGAGGVGHLAIQLAKNAGCTVITTASRSESIDYCRKTLGADLVVNYKTTPVEESVKEFTGGKGVPLIFDTVGGSTFIDSLNYLSPGGHICTILPVSFDSSVGNSNLVKNITLSYEFMGASAAYGLAPNRQREILSKLVESIDQKKLIPNVSKVFEFDQIAEAHELIEQRHTTGKIVITV